MLQRWNAKPGMPTSDAARYGMRAGGGFELTSQVVEQWAPITAHLIAAGLAQERR